MDKMSNFREFIDSEILVLAMIMKYFSQINFTREDFTKLLYVDDFSYEVADLEKLRKYKSSSIVNAIRSLTDKNFLTEDVNSSPHKYTLKYQPRAIIEVFHEQLNELFLSPQITEKIKEEFREVTKV